ncbi:hypothetical protein HNQ36_001235 [Afipia massiliensis]|uniref:Cysteine rich repeat protein n=1 Tax=Afipia massiliensis TaxID=211460 RepID=A0A840N088_9BRAD|nr:hypothetical protein [Afipia massiliensis]MBB5051281.1 hypothetical protein [Afipia massiliensis]
MVRTILIAAVLSAAVTAAFAQDSRRGGTSDQQRACSKDVSRHCRPVMKEDDFAILGCLKENRAKLSKPCLKALAESGQ